MSEREKVFKILGRIIDRLTGDGVAGLRVEAWDKDLICDDLLGSAVTDAEGAFRIEFDESYFRELFLDRQPDLFFKVFRDGCLIQSTEDSVVCGAEAGATGIVIEVEVGRMPLQEQAQEVKGTVRLADGFPARGVVVSAFDRDLRSERLLGQCETDRKGSYRVQYFARQFRKREKGSADLVLRATAADGSLLAASQVLFNAPPLAEVDLTIPAEALRPSTLFEKIGRALEPSLEGLKVEELEEDKEHQDVSFLAGETGFEKEALARFALARKLEQQGLEAEFWFALLADPFFQFDETRSLRDQSATILDSLPSLDAAAVRKSLIRGLNRNEISETFRAKIADWVEAFLQFAARQLVSQSANPSFVKLALEDAGMKGAQEQEKFARLFNEHRELTPELLDSLEKDESFKKEAIDDLRASFLLAELTRGDFSVVKMLKEKFGVRRPEKIRTLAKKSEDEWVDLIKTRHAAGDIRLPFEAREDAGPVKLPEAEVYGKTLARQFREAFPTTAFVGGLERALRSGGARGLRRAEELSRFLERHENFELLNTPIDDFLRTSLATDFQELARDENFRLEVKAVQRVFKLAPTFEATDALLADGLHSARQVYRLGESEFARRYSGRDGFTAESARLAWNRAADTYAAVLTIVGDLKALELEALPEALKNGNQALSTFPNWNNLFRTGDLCECEHCRSMLSPAAYFADLLMFLKDRQSSKTPTNPGDAIPTVKDILFSRRPDLGYLELNCENALTPLPYIDTVNEVLEDVVAGDENDLELTGFEAMPANAVAAKAAVAAAFSAKNISLGADFSLSQVDPSNPDAWVAHGDDVTYLLEKNSSPNFIAKLLRNTKASAAELRAYPQHVNPKAYSKLRQARYPAALPFDLFAEEVRAAFQKTNLRRWELMRALRGSAAPNNPTEGDIAAEYFGISAAAAGPALDEKRLILDADPTATGQQEVWGEPSNDAWLNKVGKVTNFLQKTGLEYKELLALLDLKFINPAGDIAVDHLDASCDTDKKVIRVLNATKLDRLHRFLRLWRKLKGWKMWELDLVIRHPRIGNGLLNEPFLIKLFYFCEVKNRLGGKATVEQTLALFGNLNTETRFTGLHEKREDALYQSSFLNRRLIQPLDPAFEFDPATNEIKPVINPITGLPLIDPLTGLPARHKLSDHHPVVLAALGLRETDLMILKELTKASDGQPYITGDLTLANLSFLWRHAWLSRMLKFNAADWKVLLKIFKADEPDFASPKAALELLETVDHLKAAGFTPDELSWLLAADRSAQAAVKEADAARFLAALHKELQAVQAEHDPARYDFLTAAPPTDVASLTALLTSLLQKLNRDEVATQSFISTLRGEIKQEKVVANLPEGFTFPAAITGAPNHISIRYDLKLSFTGLMTEAERETLLTDPSLAAVTGIDAYRDAVEEFFNRPRLALKFFEPVFNAPLANLPAEVDFKTLADPLLARNISYDAEQRLLRFAGILSKDEKAALDALSADASYLAAVDSLFTQPATGVFPAEMIWLQDADLLFPLRDLDAPAGDNLAQNLATATTKALAYLSKTLSTYSLVQQASAQLGLTPALTRLLLTRYALLPDTLLERLTGAFVATSGVVDYATLKNTFDGWFWANRVAAILKKWNVTLAELEKLIALRAGSRLLDFLTLPLDDDGPTASLGRFLRTSRLLKARDSLPETGITLLEVLEKLDGAAYPAAAFAADVELLNNAWPATNAQQLVASLNLSYPADYLLAESWERLRRAFYFLDNLNASPDTVKVFAAPAMSDTHARTLKELLRSKFGTETWLTLSAEIQDALRERKRDALAAYLLTRKKPATTPSGKWENTNDLYAYYLLDVEMSACQLTSRLTQASGSVQLFVQRCLMGLEPDVEVKADGDDGDSAWRWWKWMRKYRVWEANRKVFLWPENWIEPELRRDKSEFFKDLENELLQNEINPRTVEGAFQSYLEKLDGVAQLEIAGFYQEDDGDDTILHVFGRTTGAEPHLYYYRRYDYRQWTPWEKVELDIEGNFLIPAVVNRRLFIFWPVFKEVPADHQTAEIPDLLNGTSANVPKTPKRLQLQFAMSEYRQGKWTPKKVSKDVSESGITFDYDVELVKKDYQFFPVDRVEVDGRFCIWVNGSMNNIYFEISGCKGVPELSPDFPGRLMPVMKPEWVSSGILTEWSKWVEFDQRYDSPDEDLTLDNIFSFKLNEIANFGYSQPPAQALGQTPWIFKLSPPWHLSYFDKFWLDGLLKSNVLEKVPAPVGIWLPFFYNDKQRTFFVLPSLVRGKDRSRGGERVRSYYPEIKEAFRREEVFYEAGAWSLADLINLSSWTPAHRHTAEQILFQEFRGTPPPYTDQQIKELVKRSWMRVFHFQLGLSSWALFQTRRFHFKNFYHPFACDFAKLVYNPLQGIPALMRRETQLKNTGFSFKQSYQPTSWVVEPATDNYHPKEVVDFSPDGAYSPYNWELFFHIPLLIANSLSKNQRFEEARDWYHFIFNPIGVESGAPGGSAMSKYWITKPFFETTRPEYVRQRIDSILRMLAGDESGPGFSAQAKIDLENQVYDWRANPFEPHRIANYRAVAYQKTVVMKYLDNLIAWGDNLFRQDSMESINEATQLYILAAEILGPRPKKIPARERPPVESFNELEKQFDAFSNALAEMENLVPQSHGPLSLRLSGIGPYVAETPPLPLLFFCIPQNDKMLSYWDTVADRLYKIRHCMNIEGVVRQLALFEPPIDPAALVKAVAGGMDISAAIADLNAPLPLYRFNVLLQKANEVCNDVKALGGALLAALEKKDAEALGLLRQSLEIRALEAVKGVREKQIEEAKENLEGLKRSQTVVEARRDYYRDIAKIIPGEQLSLDKQKAASDHQNNAQQINIGASVLGYYPNLTIGSSGFGGSPHVNAQWGTGNIISALQALAGLETNISSAASFAANSASTLAGYDRRHEDWKLQARLADKELEQIAKQIVAAELRIAIAEKELENHLLQIDNAKATDAFMRSKYTNEELYQWQVGQISGVYFQSYRLAYDLAKRAERCFRFELGLQDSSYINFGYWDSLKKGLLSGEKLQYDLRRLETAYLEQNRREFELTKHVSLALLDPLALVKLRETGRCFFRLPEEIFDLDYPGHYFRRIKSVSLTLPCVVGPYTTISCTLRLLKNSIRVDTASGDNGYPRNTDEQGSPSDDTRFVENNIPVKAIAASNAQNDSGVFELGFRDERYLPFEGAGAISEWSLELFSDFPSNNPNPAQPDFGKPLRQFDYGSISDAIVHLKYTAREDAGPFKNRAVAHLREYFSQDGATPSLRLFNLRQEFPAQWHRFLNPTNPADGNVLEIEMSPSLFPLKDVGKTLKVNSIWLLARCAAAETYNVVMTPPLPAPPVGADTMTLAPVNQYGGLHFSQKDVTALGIEITLTEPPVKWRLRMTRPGDEQNPANKMTEVEDVLLVLGYRWE